MRRRVGWWKRRRILYAARLCFGPGLDLLPEETSRLLARALRERTAIAEGGPEDLFVVRVPGHDLRVYFEAQEEPFPAFFDARIVHGDWTDDIRFHEPRPRRRAEAPVRVDPDAGRHGSPY